MHNELTSLSKIFTESLFRIPDYQRGYSWSDRQLKDFWNDLQLLGDSNDHYTGVLTLEPVPAAKAQEWEDDAWIIHSKRFLAYYVVDGQQRLTTSLILIQAIIERLSIDEEINYTNSADIRRKFIYDTKDKGVSRSYIFGYEKDNPSYEHLKTAIFGELSTLHSSGEDTVYTANLDRAKTFFHDQLAPLSLEHIESIYTKLTQHFLFNIYTISGGIDVFVAFETMNNRGKPLSHLELLKNRLIFLSMRSKAEAEDTTALRKAVNEAWKTIYHYLGRNKKAPLDDDKFLYIHFVLYFSSEVYSKHTEEQSFQYRGGPYHGEYQDLLLNSIFTARPQESMTGISFNRSHVTIDGISEYASDIKLSVKYYYEIFNPQSSHFTGDQTANLQRLERLRWGLSEPLILAALMKKATSAQLTSLLRGLERYIFIDSVRTYPRRGAIDLIFLASQVHSEKKSLAEVIQKIEGCYSNERPEDLQLFSGVSASSRSFYGWRSMRYFLFEYEQSLKTKSKSSRDKLDWESFISEDFGTDYSTVEHIFPQRAKDPYWVKVYNRFSADQKRALRNSLGNLLALSAPKNSSLGNRPFPEKRMGKDEFPGYDVGSYSEIEVSKLTDWTAVEILSRGLRMLKFFETRWGLSLGSVTEKKKLLGLNFVD